jgi:hypothetical protein
VISQIFIRQVSFKHCTPKGTANLAIILRIKKSSGKKPSAAGVSERTLKNRPFYRLKKWDVVGLFVGYVAENAYFRLTEPKPNR